MCDQCLLSAPVITDANGVKYRIFFCVCIGKEMAYKDLGQQ